MLIRSWCELLAVAVEGILRIGHLVNRYVVAMLVFL